MSHRITQVNLLMKATASSGLSKGEKMGFILFPLNVYRQCGLWMHSKDSVLSSRWCTFCEVSLMLSSWSRWSFFFFFFFSLFVPDAAEITELKLISSFLPHSKGSADTSVRRTDSEEAPYANTLDLPFWPFNVHIYSTWLHCRYAV